MLLLLGLGVVGVAYGTLLFAFIRVRSVWSHMDVIRGQMRAIPTLFEAGSSSLSYSDSSEDLENR